jgi:uncharacterized protein DUF1173
MDNLSINFPQIGAYSRDWLARNPEKAQELLAECKGRYPVCLCKHDGPKLYIAFRQKYYLARLPNTGPEHAPYCPSYEPDPALCGRGIYSSTAIKERPDGRVSVKLEVPLLIRGGGADAPPAAPPISGSVKIQRDALKLRGLLHLIWECAGFNRWAPKMEGRRHYKQVHKYCLDAAESILVRRRPLHNELFMPEPFSVADKLEIDARRAEAFKRLSKTEGGAPRRLIVLAQLKELKLTDYGCGLRLAHTPPQLIVWCDQEMTTRFHRSCDYAFIDWPAIHDEFQIIVLLTMLRNERGAWQADTLASLVTNRHYIPVNSMAEAILGKRLVEQRRYFYKPLYYDSEPGRYPNFLLSDMGDASMPLEICDDGGAAAATRNARIAQYQDDGSEYWRWDISEDREPPTIGLKATA